MFRPLRRLQGKGGDELESPALRLRVASARYCESGGRIGRLSRKRNRRSGGRYTPRGTGPESPAQARCPQRLSREAEFLLHDAGRAITEVQGLNEADEWASSIQSAFRPSADEPVPFCNVFDALSAAADQGGDAAAVLAAAIAVFGPEPARSRAQRLYRRLLERGVQVPEWVGSLGVAEPRKALIFTDEWDDEHGVCIDFTRPDGTTVGLFVVVDLTLVGYAHTFGRVATTDEFRTRAHDLGFGQTVETGLAEARAVVEAGLRQRDAWPMEHFDDEAHDGDAGESYELDEDLLALVEQRIALLPDGASVSVPTKADPEESGEIVAEFLVQQEGELSPWEAEAVKDICVFSSTCYKNDLLSWSPKKKGTRAFALLGVHRLRRGPGGSQGHGVGADQVAGVQRTSARARP